MNLSTRAEVLSKTDQGKDDRGNLDVNTAPPRPCSDEQAPPQCLAGLHVPDERDLETFVGGTGI
jgi:hypothetical protein